MFRSINPTKQETNQKLSGDDIISNADVIMDRAFTLSDTPEKVWPWFEQLGKNRAGWYFPRWVERFVPTSKQGLHYIDPNLQDLRVGKVIDDWGGRDATFEVAILQPPHTLVHKSQRGNMQISWAIILHEQDKVQTRVQLRLRLAPVKRRWLARYGGGLIDKLTVLGLAKGLEQRLVDNHKQ